MKEIKLKKSILLLPSTWEELKLQQKLFVFEILIRVLQGDLKAKPYAGLMELLVYFTGYKPSKGYMRLIAKTLRYSFRMAAVKIRNLPYLIRYGKEEFKEYIELYRQIYRTYVTEEENRKDIINFNLLRLAKEIDFIFQIDRNEKKIIPLYTFCSNPFPFIQIGRRKFKGRRFEVDVTVKTDISAREFVDCLDLLSAINQIDSDQKKQQCMNQLCAILYPSGEDYAENMVSGHHRLMNRLDPLIKFGISYWFTGVVKFYTEHPVYGILFSGRSSEDPEHNNGKVQLSSEVLLMLRKQGYGAPETMKLNDYFDAQVKVLKDMISDAISSGLSVSKIAQKTGIELSVISKLS